MLYVPSFNSSSFSIILLSVIKCLSTSIATYTSLTNSYTVLRSTVVNKDCNGKYLYCNQIYLDTVNKTFEEIKGKTEADIFPEKDAAKLNKISRRVLKGKVIRKKYKWKQAIKFMT